MTSSGVPVGDTTLLAKLRDAAAFSEENPGSTRAVFEETVWVALPAVVTLIQAAKAATEGQAASYDEGLRRVNALAAALAPFVSEATE